VVFHIDAHRCNNLTFFAAQRHASGLFFGFRVARVKQSVRLAALSKKWPENFKRPVLAVFVTVFPLLLYRGRRPRECTASAVSGTAVQDPPKGFVGGLAAMEPGKKIEIAKALSVS